MPTIKHILATAGLRPFNEPTIYGRALATVAQTLCAQAGSPYHSPSTMRYFQCKVHALTVVAEGAAYVALESVQFENSQRVYRPVVIDCAGRVADTVDLDDCTTDMEAARKWYSEKCAIFTNTINANAFVRGVIAAKLEATEYAAKELRRGLEMIDGVAV